MSRFVVPASSGELTRAVHKSQCGAGKSSSQSPFFTDYDNDSCQILTILSCACVNCRCVAAVSSIGFSMLIAQIFSRLSVRARIVVLAIIPLIGFLATGIAFVTGDAEVGSAFDSVHRDTEVAGASRDLKAGLLMMRSASTEFVARPSDAAVRNFDAGQTLAMERLDRIEAKLAASRQDVITPLRITVRDLKTSFASLVNEQKTLGFDETQGITAQLTAASNAIEHIIHDDLSWVADGDSAKLQASLLTMRRYEMEYRLTRQRAAEKNFLDEIKRFNALFQSVDGAPEMKQKLDSQVQNYRYSFAQWVASTDNIE